MGKYDFRIDRIDPTTAHGKVLMQISKGSTVLECGCATGYMTKYMRMAMGCTVDVIERDLSALKVANQYARNAFLMDLQTDRIDEVLCGFEGKYDCILFADVLEHLVNPKDVLTRSVKLLAPNGRIIVSIPNICHNDILIKMFYDRFTYTQYGILDNTHVHFWGIRDFQEMCQSIGLKIEKTDSVIIGTCGTESRTNALQVNPMMFELLKDRPYGEVFQWVFVLTKEEPKDGK